MKPFVPFVMTVGAAITAAVIISEMKKRGVIV